MKRLFLILLSLLILSPLTSFAGSFYNPDPEELKEKGREAAGKLNESFVIFYEMLKSIEGKDFNVAKEKKKTFVNSLIKKALPKFEAVYKETPDRPLKFPKLPPDLQRARNYILKEYFEQKPLDTQKKLTEVPLIVIGRLIKKSAGFQIKPEDPDFFPQLRRLIIVALDVQWVGVKVSELWAVAVY